MEQLEQNVIPYPFILLDTLNEGIYIVDRQWHFVYVNKKGAEILGKAREALLGKHVWELFPQAAETLSYAQAHRAVEENSPTHFEVSSALLKKWFGISYYPNAEGLIMLVQDITERKRQEEQRQFQATILANIHENVVVTDFQGAIIYWNKGAEHIFGYTAEEMLGKSPTLLYPTQQMCTLHANALQQVLGGEDYLGEWEGCRKDGTVIWVDICITLLRTPEGQPMGFLRLAKDVTKRRHAEALMQRQAALLELSTEAIFVLQFQRPVLGPILYWNSGAARLYGFAKEEAVGHMPYDMLQTHYSEPLACIAETLLQTGTWEGELRHTTKDGRNLVVESMMVLVTEDDGNQVILENNRDITLRKVQEEALRQSQVRARRLIDANLIGVVVADMDYILEANDAFLEMVGYTREDLEARRINWRALTPPEFFPLDLKNLQELQERGECTPFEKAYYRKDGSHVPVLMGAAVIEKDPLQWVAFMLDITERKDLEQRKDDFINMASHELKTPVTTLKTLTQLLLRQLAQQEMRGPIPILTTMDAQINRLVKLIDELLNVSKIQAGNLDYEEVPVDVDALVHETVALLQATTPTHVLNVSGATQGVIVGDKDHVSQVLTNLITNAVKYSPQANSVDIVLTSTQKSVSIAVRDYGIGIAKASQKHLFERFYRVYDERDKTFPGLGMGLYVAYEIVKQHGGAITVESEEGKGSTFLLSLPLKEAQPGSSVS